VHQVDSGRSARPQDLFRVITKVGIASPVEALAFRPAAGTARNVKGFSPGTWSADSFRHPRRICLFYSLASIPCHPERRRAERPRVRVEGPAFTGNWLLATGPCRPCKSVAAFWYSRNL